MVHQPEAEELADRAEKDVAGWVGIDEVGSGSHPKEQQIAHSHIEVPEEDEQAAEEMV